MPETPETVASFEQVAIWLASRLRDTLTQVGEPLSEMQRQQVGAMLAVFCAAMWAGEYGKEQAEEMASEFIAVWTRTLLSHGE